MTEVEKLMQWDAEGYRSQSQWKSAALGKAVEIDRLRALLAEEDALYEKTISALAELAKAAEPFIVKGVDGYAHLCFARELIAEDDKRRAMNSPRSTEE